MYRAHDRLLSQTVALKMMVANQTEQPNHLRRFKAEARTMMRLHHPNVVTVLDFGDEPQPYIAMELVHGGSASDHLERPTTMPEAKALSIVDGVLAGLIHIHAAGTIHRDIKRGSMTQLSTKLRSELSPDTVVVSNTFALPGWVPDEHVQLKDWYRTKIYRLVARNEPDA